MAAMMRMLAVIAVLLAGAYCFVDGQVPDLDDRFLEKRKTGMWLVEFYAPWCGHCKKLEPIFHQVHMKLRHTEVNVAKVDCTRYSHVASEFGVKGFPTIKFIQQDRVFTHKGDRTAEDILEFVHKAKGPPVRPLSSVGKLNEARTAHSSAVFFLFVGEEDANGDLYTKYSSIAKEQVSQVYFYAGSRRILPERVTVKNYPTLLVFKDNTYYEFEAPKAVATMSSVQQWINGERHLAYPLTSGGTINEMAEVGKFLVMFIVDLQNPDTKDVNNKIKEIGQYMATQERHKYHSAFQFLWMDDPDTANSITLSFLSLPFVLVLDPNTHLYYIPLLTPHEMDVASLGQFLEDVKSEKIPAYGGTGVLQRFKRVFYDLLVTVVSVWQSSRWLFLLMFGLPTAVISIVCYSLCCIEPIDDGAVSDDDSDFEDRELPPEKEAKPLKDTDDTPTAATDHIKAD